MSLLLHFSLSALRSTWSKQREYLDLVQWNVLAKLEYWPIFAYSSVYCVFMLILLLLEFPFLLPFQLTVFFNGFCLVFARHLFVCFDATSRWYAITSCYYFNECIFSSLRTFENVSWIFELQAECDLTHVV